MTARTSQKPKECILPNIEKQTLGTSHDVTPAICHEKIRKQQQYCHTKHWNGGHIVVLNNETGAMLAYQDFRPMLGIPESEKFLLVESKILGFGIRNTAQGIRNPTIDWNPESSWTLSSCRNFLLFYEMYIAAGHVSRKRSGEAVGTPLRHTGPWLFSLFLTWAPRKRTTVIWINQ